MTSPAASPGASTTDGRPQLKLNWTNTLFLTFAHLAAVAGVLWMIFGQFSWWTVGFAALWMGVCSMSITAGYHRLFSHRAYKASAWVRAFYLLFGAAGVQNSALLWSGDHRRHHSFTDTDKDPYDARRGFWWSHIGWVFFDGDRDGDDGRVNDLRSDKLVMFQHNYYVPLAFLMGAILPMCLGFAWGDPIGGLLVVGFVRLVFQWHMTFTINSLAHMVGTRPYNPNSTARDSWIIALVSWGEGYHSFHHRFQADYRNGHRWFHFDPTKWIVWTLSKLGATQDLRRTPSTKIAEARAAHTPS